MPYVITLSGWRLHKDEDFIFRELTTRMWPAINGQFVNEPLFFRVGDAPGSDAVCREWLASHFPHDHLVYQADWDQFGLTAGPKRNRDMLQGIHDPNGLADVLIAFPQPGVYRYKDSGTWGCVKEAFRLGVEVCVPRYKKERNALTE